jgi:hypothetical protein
MKMEYKISGIPCIIKLTVDTKDEFDWEVRDSKGYVADWLAAKLTKDDEYQITEDLIKFLRSV